MSRHYEKQNGSASVPASPRRASELDIRKRDACPKKRDCTKRSEARAETGLSPFSGITRRNIREQTSRRRNPDARPAGTRALPAQPHNRGFTLPELLVALSIFVTVMGGVTALFVNSVRMMRQGFQNQEAFELVRGAFDIIEKDLTRAFVNRDLGDHYKFYGTPIGFTFVGLTEPQDGSDTNMSRVTYVVYHDPNGEEGSVETLHTATFDANPRFTYHLIRYVEPGAEDLDSFPVPWDATLTLPDETIVDFSQVINDAITDVINDPKFNGVDPCDGAPRCLEDLRNAVKREIWIRMLSGGDDEVPNAWTTTELGPPFDEDPTGSQFADYVVAENLLHLGAFVFTQVFATDGEDNDEDGVVDETGEEIIPAGFQIIETDTGIFPTPAFPAIQATDVPNFVPGKKIQPYFNYREIRERSVIDGPSGNREARRDELGNLVTQVAPRAYQYWNDTRNFVLHNVLTNNGLDDDGDSFLLREDGIDNDGDGLVDEADLTEIALGIDEADEGGPSLLAPHLPQQVEIVLPFFFQSPYPGAPDFNREFRKLIDIPAAFQRLAGR